MDLNPEVLVACMGSQDNERHKKRIRRIIAEADSCRKEQGGKSQTYVMLCFNFVRSLEALLSSSDESLPIFLRELAKGTNHPVFKLALNAASDTLEQNALPPSLR